MQLNHKNAFIFLYEMHGFEREKYLQENGGNSNHCSVILINLKLKYNILLVCLLNDLYIFHINLQFQYVLLFLFVFAKSRISVMFCILATRLHLFL